MNIIRTVLLVVLLSIGCASAAERDEVLRRAYDQIHRGSFDDARAQLLAASRLDRAYPGSPVLLAFVDLWQGWYFGINPTLRESLRANALEGERKADRFEDLAQRSFWRAMSHVARLAADQLDAPSKGQFGLGMLFAIPKTMKELQMVEGDLRRAAAQDSLFPDAKVLLILLKECTKSVTRPCLDKLWAALNTPLWFPTDIKYLMLNLIYGSGNAKAINDRGIPIAIELHMRYPANPMFHLALAKLSYEVGNIEEAKQRHLDIIQREKEYGGSFGAESRYFLGVIAHEEGDQRAALKYLLPILIARPVYPEYLLPWAFLRVAECYAALGSGDLANFFANEAVRTTEATDVHFAARRVLKSLGRLK